jgi:nitroreductase
MNKQVLNFILQRRSIRKFKPKKIPQELINLIVEAGQRAPTACGMQTYSFIHVKDRKIRQAIFEAIGKQECMEQAPVWIIICADMARQLELFQILGVKTEFGELGKLVPSVIDATLAAENMVLAAEVLGLGSVFIGTVWEAIKRIAEILKLPPNVLPILLLCLGYPDENPPIRPRWPLEAVLHENFYKMPSKELMKQYYDEANKRLVEMRYFRGNVQNWAEHWQRKFPLNEMKKWEENLRKDLRELGFCP